MKAFFVAIVFASYIHVQAQDDFILRGQVLSTCFVQIADEAVATNLDLTVAGHTSTPVATVSVFTNTTSIGSAIGINDDTGSLLVNQSDATQTVPYTLNYNSADTGTTNNNIVVPSPTPFVLDFKVSNGGFSGVLSINVAADPALEEGSYEANVTISCTVF